MASCGRGWTAWSTTTLVRGEGIDGHHITVRQLLQHTSGLPNYTAYTTDEDLAGEGRHTYVQPRALLDVAFAHKADFAPGTSWTYSNTNYVLAGLIIEKVTRRPSRSPTGSSTASGCATPTSPTSARNASGKPTLRATSRRSPGRR